MLQEKKVNNFWEVIFNFSIIMYPVDSFFSTENFSKLKPFSYLTSEKLYWEV